jgi:hypothetical protein
VPLYLEVWRWADALLLAVVYWRARVKSAVARPPTRRPRAHPACLPLWKGEGAAVTDTVPARGGCVLLQGHRGQTDIPGEWLGMGAVGGSVGSYVPTLLGIL